VGSDEVGGVVVVLEDVEKDPFPQSIDFLYFDDSDFAFRAGCVFADGWLFGCPLLVGELFFNELRFVLPVPLLNFLAELVYFLFVLIFDELVVGLELFELIFEFLGPLD
jgi:hypothetical protein